MLLLCSSVLLSACQTTITKYEPLIYTFDIPQSLRSCANLPKRPTGNYTQKDVGEFIARLDTARRDCKTKLGELVDLIDRQNANALELNHIEKK